MAYVDGFVAAVPTANREIYLDYARKFDALFIAHGALKAVECWGDDVPDGKLTDFKGKKAVVVAWFPKAFTGG